MAKISQLYFYYFRMTTYCLLRPAIQDAHAIVPPTIAVETEVTVKTTRQVTTPNNCQWFATKYHQYIKYMYVTKSFISCQQILTPQNISSTEETSILKCPSKGLGRFTSLQTKQYTSGFSSTSAVETPSWSVENPNSLFPKRMLTSPSDCMDF